MFITHLPKLVIHRPVLSFAILVRHSSDSKSRWLSELICYIQLFYSSCIYNLGHKLSREFLF